MPYYIELLEAQSELHARQLGVTFERGLPVWVDPDLYARNQPDNYRLELGEWWTYYRKDGSLYLRHPSRTVIGRLVYTLTFVWEEDASPCAPERERAINERWLANAYWGNRPQSLRSIAPALRALPVTWYVDREPCYTLGIGEIADLLLDPTRIAKHKGYRWLKDRRLMPENWDPTILPWKAPGYTVLWELADKLRADRSEVAHTHDRWREKRELGHVLDAYYQPLVPDAEVVDFVRFAKAEGMNAVFTQFDLTEPEAQEVALSRDQRIVEAIRTYPADGKRTKRQGWPWLWPLRSHAGMPDITSEERRRAWKTINAEG